MLFMCVVVVHHGWSPFPLVFSMCTRVLHMLWHVSRKLGLCVGDEGSGSTCPCPQHACCAGCCSYVAPVPVSNPALLAAPFVPVLLCTICAPAVALVKCCLVLVALPCDSHRHVDPPFGPCIIYGRCWRSSRGYMCWTHLHTRVVGCHTTWSLRQPGLPTPPACNSLRAALCRDLAHYCTAACSHACAPCCWGCPSRTALCSVVGLGGTSGRKSRCWVCN
jgi:hypothetical protein